MEGTLFLKIFNLFIFPFFHLHVPFSPNINFSECWSRIRLIEIEPLPKEILHLVEMTCHVVSGRQIEHGKRSEV